jgi:DNA ligase D-like protein (predicted ligase)
VAADPFAALDEEERALLRRQRVPSKVTPMKAVLCDTPFSDPDWIYERKLDGIRCIAIKAGGSVRLLSRNDLPMNTRYPEVVEALEADPADDFVIDGEVVAFAGEQSGFATLARRGREHVDVRLYAFDILYLAGHDVRALPLRARKPLLEATLRFGGAVHFSDHSFERGEELLAKACELGWEGLIAKRWESPYASARSRDWLKLKCNAEQELVIGGYTEPRGSRVGLGALLMGHFRGDEFLYAGKVGTGFDRATLLDLVERLEPLRRDDPPFTDEGAPRKGTTWVEPRLVAQIGFMEWTRDGRLRHPRFLGLRDDKDARDVVREQV